MRKDIEITTKEAEKGDLGQNHIFEMNATFTFSKRSYFPLLSAYNSLECCFAIIFFDNGFQIRFGFSVFLFFVVATVYEHMSSAHSTNIKCSPLFFKVVVFYCFFLAKDCNYN